MIATYLIVFNVLLDANTLCIVIIINLINKTLTFSKGIHLGSIHKYIDILYIITNITKAFIAVIIASIAVFEPFTTIQKAAVLGSQYQRTSLTLAPFENGIFTMNIKFIFTLEIKAILIAEYIIRLDLNPESTLCTNDLLKPASSIPINDAVYTIIANII